MIQWHRNISRALRNYFFSILSWLRIMMVTKACAWVQRSISMEHIWIVNTVLLLNTCASALCRLPLHQVGNYSHMYCKYSSLWPNSWENIPLQDTITMMYFHRRELFSPYLGSEGTILSILRGLSPSLEVIRIVIRIHFVI